MSKISTRDCKQQINQILSKLDWKRISKTKSGSDIQDTIMRVFQSGIFKACVYTDTKDESFVSVKFALKQFCDNCACSDEKATI